MARYTFPRIQALLVAAFICVFFLKSPAQPVKPSPCFVYISDTQAPMWVESIIRQLNDNEKATALLLNDIVNRKPSEAFMLGDVVNLAFRENRWSLIDSTLGRLRKEGCPVHACLGNHELMGKPTAGEKEFQQRFPDHVKTGFVIVSDSVATVMLNSNFSKMTSAEVLRQQAWYDSTLQALDTADGIRAVVVACHHPPYSDSQVVGSSKEVQDRFVPAYLHSRRAILFLSGHAHLFQHKVYKGKNFLVIGGGGGPSHAVGKNEDGIVDLCANYKPPFHYLTIARQPDRLQAISYRLTDDFSQVVNGYHFDIPLPGK